MEKNQKYFLPYPLPLNKIRENAQSGTESDKKQISAGAFQLEWDRHTGDVNLNQQLRCSYTFSLQGLRETA
jgi:hypothetical protein